jgi:hypothetical protein
MGAKLLRVNFESKAFIGSWGLDLLIGVCVTQILVLAISLCAASTGTFLLET